MTASSLRFLKCLIAPLLGAALFSGTVLAHPPQTGLGITVQVYNWASVVPQILTVAEDEATRVFHQTGVAVSWLNCPLSTSEAEANPICIEPCPPSRLAVRINSEMPANLAKTSLGIALSDSGVYATIYYPRVEEYSKEGIATHSQILGHAIAHEMGHLLLGPVPHARFGIMRGEWKAEDLQSITRGAFLFSPRQSAVIRQAAMRRFSASSFR